MASEDTTKSSPIALILSWVIAGLPLVWGITQTFNKALALFK